jgi:hypothetical protein
MNIDNTDLTCHDLLFEVSALACHCCELEVPRVLVNLCRQALYCVRAACNSQSSTVALSVRMNMILIFLNVIGAQHRS